MATEIPQQLWFVKHVSAGSDSELAYVTGYEDNAAGRKRQETGLRWAGKGRTEYERDEKGNVIRDENGHYKTKQLPDPVGKIVDNKPIKGWKISDKAVRWTTSNVVWRIESPHGFTFEIYSGNMIEILKCSTIKNGEIMDDCVIGKGNVLLPVTSNPYKEARKFTDLKQNRTGKPSQLVAGDNVTLADGLVYKFMGKLFCLQSVDTIEGRDTIVSFEWTDKPFYFFKRAEKGWRSIEGVRTPRILKIEPNPEDTDFVSEINSETWIHAGILRNVVAVSKEKSDYKIVTEYFELNAVLTPAEPIILNDYFYLPSSGSVGNGIGTYIGYACTITDKTIKFLEPNKWVTSIGYRTGGYSARNPISIDGTDVFNMAKMYLSVDGKKATLKRLMY